MLLLSLYLSCSIAAYWNCLVVATPTSFQINHSINRQSIPSHNGEEDVYGTGLSEDRQINNATSQPFYMIAHRVLTVQSVRDAVSNGANALEIDMYAWKKGWYADHDGTAGSAGDTASDMFLAIAEERKAGKTITFVWLDIKNPDYCDLKDPTWKICSITTLQELSRKLLEPYGVGVLYGFYRPDKPSFKFIASSLNTNEAINLNGKADSVILGFSQYGPSQITKRVMSYGYYNLALGFEKTFAELSEAKASKDFGKVFGWTSSAGQSSLVNRLLGDAGIDGLIYGFKATYYYDNKDTRAAAHDIMSWVETHPNDRHMATQSDKPW